MRAICLITFVVVFSLSILAADEPNLSATRTADLSDDSQDSTTEIPDVNTIVNKANFVAYYQGDDGL